MFASTALKTVGLVWKPIRHKPTTRRNDRAQAKRVADVEAFLRPYGLKSWNKTAHSRSVNLENVNAVAKNNFEAEAKIEAVNAAKREKSAKKAIDRRIANEQAVIKGKASRTAAAAKVLASMQSEGSLRPYPTF